MGLPFPTLGCSDLTPPIDTIYRLDFLISSQRHVELKATHRLDPLMLSTSLDLIICLAGSSSTSKVFFFLFYFFLYTAEI